MYKKFYVWTKSTRIATHYYNTDRVADMFESM